MRVNIRGGTVDHGDPPLCSSCRYATIAKGPGLRDEIVSCGRMPFNGRLIRFPVHSCTDYSNRAHPTLYQMEEIAWVLRTNPVRNRVGFVQARQLKDDDRHVLDDD